MYQEMKYNLKLTCLTHIGINAIRKMVWRGTQTMGKTERGGDLMRLSVGQIRPIDGSSF